MHYQITDHYSEMVSLGVRLVICFIAHSLNRIVGLKSLKYSQNSALWNFNQMAEKTRRPYKALLLCKIPLSYTVL